MMGVKAEFQAGIWLKGGLLNVVGECVGKTYLVWETCSTHPGVPDELQEKERWTNGKRKTEASNE